MGRRVRLGWGALALSLLLHGSLLGGLEWRFPYRTPPPEPPPIEVRLVAAPPPAAAAAVSPAPRPPSVRRPAIPRPAVPPPSPPPVMSATEPPAAAAEVPAGVAVEPAMTPSAAQSPSPAVGVPVVESPPAEPPVSLNALPPRIDLRFEVRYGLASGEQTLVWVNDGEHYTLTSVVGATGLTGLFYQGRFVQTSRGRMTPHGLQPEEFWDQRGDRRSSARFDPAQGRITLMPEKGAPHHFAYRGEVQDALSLFFQLALTAPPPDGRRLTYQVFNGKKLRDYTYEVRGEAMLDTALGALRTLHIVRVADDDGRFEAWLAIDRHYLPVRMLRSDEDGREMELRVQSIAP